MNTLLIQTASQLHAIDSKPHYVFAPGSEGEAIFKCVICIAVFIYLCCFAISFLKKWGKPVVLLLCIIFVCGGAKWIIQDYHHRSEETEMLKRAPEIYNFLQNNFARIDANHNGQIEVSELNDFTADGPEIDNLNYLKKYPQYHGHLARIQILPGNDKYVYALDRDDLEAFRLWALAAYQYR